VQFEEDIMSKLALYIRNKAKPGMRDDVRRVWEKHVRANIAGTNSVLSYYYCHDEKDPDTVIVFVLVSDKTSRLKEILEQPWYADYKRETGAMLAESPEVRTATAEWVKGAA
jgi:quinol monooxygenase YgiN